MHTMPGKMNRSKDELVQSFPLALHDDVRTALSALPEDRYSHNWTFFSLRLGRELLSIPRRIYLDAPFLQTVRLTPLQSQLLDCLFTRHHDGIVRQKHLARIIRSQDIWIPCFVVPLVGEYVVEILQVIQENLTHLHTSTYADFVLTNPEFLALTEQRVISYWDRYYRPSSKKEYPGFLVLDFLKSLATNGNQ
jgi:hypothetical protein